MPRYRPYTGPIGAEDFTPFSGDSTFFKITRDATPELYALVEKFPAAFSSALKSFGWFIRGEMESALMQGGPKNATWPALSKMHVYRRMDLLKAGQIDDLSGQWVHGRRFYLKKRLGYQRVKGNERLMDRWKVQSRTFLRGTSAMGGRLVTAVRYQMINKNRVDIGALNPSAAMFLAAVQAGARGSRGAFQFTGTQTITPAMRRAFWAAGIPLAKGKTVLEQVPRPLVAPVFHTVTPEMEKYMVAKITAYLAKHGIERG
jgi:hypothetical protein